MRASEMHKLLLDDPVVKGIEHCVDAEICGAGEPEPTAIDADEDDLLEDCLDDALDLLAEAEDLLSLALEHLGPADNTKCMDLLINISALLENYVDYGADEGEAEV